MAHVPVYHFLTERSILQETPQLSIKNDVYWGADFWTTIWLIFVIEISSSAKYSQKPLPKNPARNAALGRLQFTP